MSELQSDAMESETVESEAIENQEIETDLAPVSEAEHEEQPQVDEDAAKQEAINKAINKKHFEAKQAERERDEANAKLAEFERKEREAQAAQVNNLPEWPDEFDDDFEQKKANYIEAVRRQEAFNVQQNIYTQQQQFYQQQEAQAKQLETSKALQDHSERVKASGIDANEMLAAENAILNYGLPPELLVNIANDADSPLIVKYLAGSAQEGFDLASLARYNPYGVGQFLDGIKQKAGALKPKTSNAPKPATNLQGNGVDPEIGKYKQIKGATFE